MDAAVPPTREELERVVTRSVSSAFHESISIDGSSATVAFKQNDSDPLYQDYFTTGDKQNKILAIETTRWFRDLPGLQTLRVTVPGETETSLALDREAVRAIAGRSNDCLEGDIE